jgi:hypothetical protein
MALIYSYPLADEVTNDSWVLGSEMDNGSRVVKNYSVGDLASFTRGFVTLNDVLDNDNVSQIDAKVGGIFLYNSHGPSGLGYPYITGNKNRFNFYNNVGEYYGNLSQDTLSLTNVGDEYQLSIMKPAAVTANRTVTFQDADGIIALTSDIPPLEDVLVSGNITQLDASIGVLGLWDSLNGGYGYISSDKNRFNFNSPTGFDIGYLIKDALVLRDASPGLIFQIRKPSTITASRSVSFQDADGIVAYLSDIPRDLEQVLAVGNTATAGALNTLTLTGSIVSIKNPISNEGIALRRDSLRFYRNDILNEIGYQMDLIPPFNLAANRTIEFPDADGTVALTVYLPQVANNFANDAAAAIGGIAVGGLYHTAGTVKIRLV